MTTSNRSARREHSSRLRVILKCRTVCNTAEFRTEKHFSSVGSSLSMQRFPKSPTDQAAGRTHIWSVIELRNEVPISTYRQGPGQPSNRPQRATRHECAYLNLPCASAHYSPINQPDSRVLDKGPSWGIGDPSFYPCKAFPRREYATFHCLALPFEKSHLGRRRTCLFRHVFTKGQMVSDLIGTFREDQEALAWPRSPDCCLVCLGSLDRGPDDPQLLSVGKHCVNTSLCV